MSSCTCWASRSRSRDNEECGMELFLTQEVEGVESEPASLQKTSSAVAEAEMPECRDHTMPEDNSQGENEARSLHNDWTLVVHRG